MSMPICSNACVYNLIKKWGEVFSMKYRELAKGDNMKSDAAVNAIAAIAAVVNNIRADRLHILY